MCVDCSKALVVSASRGKWPDFREGRQNGRVVSNRSVAVPVFGQGRASAIQTCEVVYVIVFEQVVEHGKHRPHSLRNESTGQTVNQR